MIGSRSSNPSALAVALRRYESRLLDPSRNPSSGPGAVRGATTYRAAGLLIRALPGTFRDDVEAAIRTAAAEHGCDCDFTDTDVSFRARDGGSTPDPWHILTTLRRTDQSIGAAVGLDHLLSMAEQPGGNPLALGHGRPGLDHYGAPEFPGRGPVAFQVPRPVPGPARADRSRPRVLVLDTGVGRHPWFDNDATVRAINLPSVPATPRTADPDAFVRPNDQGLIGSALLGSLGTHAGHGTFIAGLIRQGCPSAIILSATIMGSDGIVAEQTLTGALADVLSLAVAEPGQIDALVLSLGFYAETADDLSYTSHLHEIFVGLARAGVAVFCAAGNDATSRPSYPAAFAADPDIAQDPAAVPLTSVAALNPNGTSATFSNSGPWVTAAATGVGLVSSIPVAAEGSSQSGIRTVPAVRVGGLPRSGPDPDDFLSGFASWSGTSFAAPVLAARYLTELRDEGAAAGCAERRAALRRALDSRPSSPNADGARPGPLLP